MTASISAFDGQIGQAAYSASKGGVASLTLPLAREFAQHGIRVVSIAPGVFDTPMMQAAPDKLRQSLIDQTPLPRRFGHPDEFAALVCHIFENDMLNGCVLRLDGALRMGPK
jgi:NAD(P)-dependent dehydrogenase (short-subunit alcohol dehydrogenase family)